MLIKRTRRQLSAAALLVAVLAFLPGASRAAATFCLNGYGAYSGAAHYDPATGETHNVFCEPGYVGTVKPTDSLTGQAATAHFIYNSGSGKLGGPNKGDLMVHGIAAPGASVRVTATDGVNSIWRVVTATATDDDTAGKPAGSFEFSFGAGHFYDPNGDGVTKCANDPNHGTDPGLPALHCPWMVGFSDLGGHTASGADKNTVNLADLGPSTITLTATWTGGSVSSTVTKYAAATKDTFAPSIGGNCLDNDDASNAPHYSPCVPPSYWCHSDSLVVSFGGGCTYTDGHAAMQGFAWDDPGSSFGHGSEIADIRLVVTKGADVLMDRSILSGRQGPIARWNYDVKIADWEPNCILADPFGIADNFCTAPYKFTVDVVDAWGNTASHNSGDVNIYPQ